MTEKSSSEAMRIFRPVKRRRRMKKRMKRRYVVERYDPFIF
ncbi:MAG: hypothetical protein QW753_01915 [Thermofilum sp.]